MALRFQVYAEFSFSGATPQLVGANISSTHAACSLFPFNPYPHKTLTISHIFPTLQRAKSYIAHLHRVYPDSLAPPPVLDNGQGLLF